MSSYTMQLREYIEMWSQDEERLSTRDIIEKGRQHLFDFEYPIFDSEYKAVFETNFIRNFYMREIGFETEGLFKFQLESWLLINMPYFNKLFESELIQFDPLVNSEIETSTDRNKDTNSTVNSTQNGDSIRTNNQTVNGNQNDTMFNRLIHSNTPDGRLQLTTNDGAGIIEYASQIDEKSGKSNSTTTNNVSGSDKDVSSLTGDTKTNITDTESYVQSRKGKVGSVSYSKMLNEYRDSLLRVERKIFDEMQQLFMLVY